MKKRSKLAEAEDLKHCSMKFSESNDVPDIPAKRLMIENGDGNKVMKPNNLMLAIKDLVGMRFWSTGDSYTIEEHDLATLYEIFNEHLFKDRLPRNIAFFIYPESKTILARGAFKVLKNGSAYIEITQLPKDNLYWVSNALLHEMIHMADYLFGEWSILKDDYDLRLDRETREFYIGEYNLHEGFFKMLAERANKLGMNAQKRDFRVAPFAPEVDFAFVFEHSEASYSDKELEKIIEDSIITDDYKRVVVKDGEIVSITVA